MKTSRPKKKITIILPNGKEFSSVPDVFTQEEEEEILNFIRDCADGKMETMQFNTDNGQIIFIPNELLKQTAILFG
ncbi:MAG: hypothetical protein GY827_04660 [Cytophagales bacterium]|nr:hypothetical protein [Cytophagales bacterium]